MHSYCSIVNFEYISQAVDGGSGHEFVLPHMPASVSESPSKAIEGFSTVSMKVFNGIVHGDRRSHVILSPGVIGATASHTCECLAIMINTAYAEHENLPSKLSVQSTVQATTSKCIAVLAYRVLYVLDVLFIELEGPLPHGASFSRRVRCIPSSPHAVHARHFTLCVLEELRSITRGAHERIRDEAVLNLIVGHDVLALAVLAGGQPSNSLFAFGAGLGGLLAPCNTMIAGLPPTPIHSLQG